MSNHRTQHRMTFMRQLAEAGINDVLVLRRETAERVLTEKRIELVEVIANETVESKRELAREVERDISIVSRDLDVLFEASVIEYEQNGSSQRPVLAHENVVVEPIVSDGTVVGAGDTDSEVDEAVAR